MIIQISLLIVLLTTVSILLVIYNDNFLQGYISNQSDEAGKNWIHLRKQSINVRERNDHWEIGDLNEEKSFVVNFKHGIPSQEELTLGLNLKFGDYIPYNSILVSGSVRSMKELKRKFSDIQYVHELQSDEKSVHSDKEQRDLLIHHNWVERAKILSGRRMSPRRLEHVSPNDETEFFIQALVVEHGSIDELQRSIKDWGSELMFKFGNKVNIAVATRRIVSVRTISTYVTNEIVNWLKKKAIVHWVEVKTPTLTHLKYSSKLIQSFDNPTESPLHELGLTGKGQIIGIGDTGIDFNHCFFHDTDKKPSITQEIDDDIPDSSHRKIQGIWALIDEKESEQGHGTHVCGIASGKAHSNANDKVKEYQSLAPDSKLAIIDLGCDTEGGCKCPTNTPCECLQKPQETCPKKFGVVYLPRDLQDGYFRWFYQNGVRINSNSWGTGYYKDFSYGYSISSAEIDEFVWKHKDFLPMFAAGNSGGLFGYASLTSESESKNSLSVGASMSTTSSFSSSLDLTDFEPVVGAIRTELFQIYCVGPYKSSPVAHIISEHERQQLCEVAKNFKEDDCCGDIDDQIACTDRKNCCGTQKFKPFESLGYRCCKKCIQGMMSAHPEYFDKENMASFSARGPTIDGRVKPDLVTVGDKIVSSKSLGSDNNNVCSHDQEFSEIMQIHEGTSMAVPNAAAAGSVVRQYLVDGYYPWKKKDANGPHAQNKIPNPSASLVKAMLIHSTRILNGYIHLLSHNIWRKLDEVGRWKLQVPYFEGHGAIDLVSVLKNPSKDFRIILPNPEKDRELTTKETHTYCIQVVKPVSEFKATLVWSDYPSSPASKLHLVNDLDLIVVGSNKVYYGNGIHSHIQSSRNEPDYLNNVEQIVIPVDILQPDSHYNVIVRGNYVPKGPQPYSLVLSGDIRLSKRTDLCKVYSDGSRNEGNLYKILFIIVVVFSFVVIIGLIAISIYFFVKYKAAVAPKGYSKLQSSSLLRPSDRTELEDYNHLSD